MEKTNMDESQHCNKTSFQNNMLKLYQLNQYSWQAYVCYSFATLIQFLLS